MFIAKTVYNKTNFFCDLFKFLFLFLHHGPLHNESMSPSLKSSNGLNINFNNVINLNGGS